MKKDFIEFNKHITISNEKEKLAIYNDDEGNYTIYPLASLICKCEYVELDKQQLIVARFNQIVPQDMILPKKTIETQISKSEITHKDADKFTIVTSTKEVSYCWMVTDGLGNSSIFLTKDEALDVAEKHNKEIIKCL